MDFVNFQIGSSGLIDVVADPFTSKEKYPVLRFVVEREAKAVQHFNEDIQGKYIKISGKYLLESVYQVMGYTPAKNYWGRHLIEVEVRKVY